MGKSSYHIGDHDIKATGDFDISCVGTTSTMQISAAGEEGALRLGAGATVGAFSGSASMIVENNEPEAGTAILQAGETGTVNLGVGPAVGGVKIKLQGPELLEMTVGEPGVGASITMTPESIIFKVAEVSFTLSPEGIVEDVGEVTREATVEGHNLTAGETEMNVGVEGFVLEGPSIESEIEGGTVVNETLGECSTDAAKSLEASITTML
jgi:hypothetical protein